MNRETLVKKAKVIISVSNVQHVRRGYTVYCYEQVAVSYTHLTLPTNREV